MNKERLEEIKRLIVEYENDPWFKDELKPVADCYITAIQDLLAEVERLKVSEPVAFDTIPLSFGKGEHQIVWRDTGSVIDIPLGRVCYAINTFLWALGAVWR